MSDVRAKIENPNDIELTITATFTLRAWKQISADLTHKYMYPMSELADAIRDCTYQIEKAVVPEPKENDQ